MTSKHDQAIDIARKMYADPSDDDIEIDDNPATSPSDNGVWVAAWVWVSNEAIAEADLADDCDIPPVLRRST